MIPLPRDRACRERLAFRDSWNISEIKIQELFNLYDRDNSGQLEQEEFRQLLRDFNDGRSPSEREFAFTLRLADTDENGCIGVNELHGALRSWHSYRHIDDDALTVFAEFDTNDRGGLNVSSVKELLTDLNRGMPVSKQEAQSVLERSDAAAGPINRSELLGAVAAWYVNIDRASTEIPALVKEAVVRTARDSDHSAVLDEGAGLWSDMSSLLRGASGGYRQVNDAEAGRAGRPASREQSAPTAADTMSNDPLISGAGGTTSGGEDPARDRLSKAMPLLTKACGKFCYAGFPFIFGLVLVASGWRFEDNTCPRNLDGVLIWFGGLAIVLGVLAHVRNGNANASRARLALAVLLVLLDFIGLAWTKSQRVQDNKTLCGHFLVFWSIFVWNGIALAAGAYAFYHLGSQMFNLRSHDKDIQRRSPNGASVARSLDW